MNADERRFIARAYIALARLFLSAAPCRNQEASPQSAQSQQRDGGAGMREDGGGAVLKSMYGVFHEVQTSYFHIVSL